jgi:hypothetical protein
LDVEAFPQIVDKEMWRLLTRGRDGEDEETNLKEFSAVEVRGPSWTKRLTLSDQV